MPAILDLDQFDAVQPACEFCGIVAGTVPASIAFETGNLVAFHSRKPVAPVHVVVIPKRHIPNLGKLTRGDAALLADVYLSFEGWARAEKLRGWRVVTNYGRQAGQRVPHLSFHFLSGRHMTWPPG